MRRTEEQPGAGGAYTICEPVQGIAKRARATRIASPSTRGGERPAAIVTTSPARSAAQVLALFTALNLLGAGPDHSGTYAALGQSIEPAPLASTHYTGYMWKLLGDRHKKARRYPEAEDCYLKAAELERDWALPWQLAADAVEQMAGWYQHEEAMARWAEESAAQRGWFIQRVDGPGDDGHFTSLALDVAGNPHISYQNLAAGCLKYAVWDGQAWDIQTVDTGATGHHTSLALDAEGHPHITCRTSGLDLRYASWDGAAWNVQTVDRRAGGLNKSLALDARGFPHISYRQVDSLDLKYAAWDGQAWDIETVDSEGDVGWWTSLALDALGYPHISYRDRGNGDVKYAAWNGAAWDTQTVDSEGNLGDVGSCLKLDADGRPHISYCDMDSGELRHASWNGTEWTIETVDSGRGLGWNSALALEGGTDPRISYYEHGTQDLKYAAWNGEGWDIEIVDPVGWTGMDTSLAVDREGHTHIAYFDGTTGSLKYATTKPVQLPQTERLAEEAARYAERPWDYRAKALEVAGQYGGVHRDNLEIGLRTAISLAKHAADQGDQEAQERFIRLGEEATEKAGPSANGALVDAIVALSDGVLSDQAAGLFSTAGRHEEAVALMEHAVSLDPTCQDGRHFRAQNIFRAAGASDRLLRLYEDQGDRDPENTWLTVKAAEVCWWAGRHPEMRRWLERGEALAQSDSAFNGLHWLHLDWGRLHEAEGNLEQARHSYRRSGELFPADSQWASDPGTALARLDVLAQAGEVVDVVCRWVREELGPETAGGALQSALKAGAEDRPWTAVSAALDTVADDESDRVARWAGELARQYPENLAAAWAAGEVTGEWDRARELLGELVADDPLNPHSQLALWSATKEDDPEGAIPAAMAAVSCAEGGGSREAYAEVAEFLAEADLEAGLQAFASRLDATGGIGGPLGRGYVRLVGATGDWDRLSEAADPILASSDDALAEDAACMLSRAGRHAEATELMEHAIRIKPSAAQANHWAPAPRVFADAGQMPRLVKLYDQVTSQHPDDASIALAAACAMLGAGDRDRARHWLERAEAILPGNAWIARQWAIWYEREGLLDDARRAWEQAQTRGLSGVAEGLERIEVLGEATAPVQTAMGVYVGYDLEQWPAPYRAAGTAATEAGKAGRPWMAVAAVLRTLADQDPERMVQGARRVAEDYPGNLAAMVGLAVIATGIETEGLDSPASAARAALDAIDDVEPGLVPCVYVVCGESLLHEGGREEAADAFRKAVEAPGITPGWEARAEAGLQAASETGREPEEEG